MEDLDPKDEPDFEQYWLQELERLEAGVTTSDVNTDKKEAPDGALKAQREATLLSWQATFNGKAHDLLVQRIRSLAGSDNTLYARFLPIVQSSGTGKSRMVDESSKSIFTIPICTRLKSVASTIPPGDASVLEFMTSTLTVKDTVLSPDAHWSLFFLGLFGALAQSTELLNPANCSPEHWRTKFTEGMDLDGHNAFRIQFFKDAVRIAKEELQLCQASADLAHPAQTAPSHSPVPKVKGRLRTGAAFALRKLVEASERHRSCYEDAAREPDELVLNIVFDEAHTVLASDDDPKLAGFRSALRTCIEVPVVCTLLTTSSLMLMISGKSLRAVLPPRSLDPSERVNDGRLQPPEPFHQTGWDQFYTPAAPKSDQDLLKFENMVVFGRPLFAARYFYGKDSLSQSDLVAFARGKLLNTFEWDPSAVSGEQRLALLGPLAPLALSAMSRPYKVLFKFQDKMLKSHLGILAKYHPHLGLMEVTRPSEPILALAALSALHSLSESVVKFFTGTSQVLMLSRGELGELLAMLMFVIAHRRATWSRTNAESAANALSYAVNPSTWLQPTPTQAFMEQILRCDGDQAGLLASFTSKMGNTRLLQFIRIEENALPSETQMTWAYQRGCGFACYQYQRGTDLIIPTSTGGAILVEVKNRTQFYPSNQDEAHRRLSKSRSKMPCPSSERCIQLLLNIGSRSTKQPCPVKVFYSTDKEGFENKSTLAITVNALEGLALLGDKPADPKQVWFGKIEEAQVMLRYESKSQEALKTEAMNMSMKPLAGPGQEYLSFCCPQASALGDDVEMT